MENSLKNAKNVSKVQKKRVSDQILDHLGFFQSSKKKKIQSPCIGNIKKLSIHTERCFFLTSYYGKGIRLFSH